MVKANEDATPKRGRRTKKTVDEAAEPVAVAEPIETKPKRGRAKKAEPVSAASHVAWRKLRAQFGCACPHSILSWRRLSWRTLASHRAPISPNFCKARRCCRCTRH